MDKVSNHAYKFHTMSTKFRKDHINFKKKARGFQNDNYKSQYDLTDYSQKVPQKSKTKTCLHIYFKRPPRDFL